MQRVFLHAYHPICASRGRSYFLCTSTSIDLGCNPTKVPLSASCSTCAGYDWECNDFVPNGASVGSQELGV